MFRIFNADFRDYSKCITHKIQRKVGVNNFLNSQIHGRQPSQKNSAGGSFVPMKRDQQRAANCTDPCPCLSLSIPSTLANISHLQTAELEHHKVPVPPDHTRSLSVFLAWRAHKSLAQVHSASCGTFRAITSCSKAPRFCLTYKKHKALGFTYSFSQSLSRKNVKRDTA